jgi:hypothetical protein
LLCNSGIVLTARISEPSAGDGDDKTEEEAFGIDNVLLLLLDIVVVPTSGVEIVVEGVDDDVGRTNDLIFS